MVFFFFFLEKRPAQSFMHFTSVVVKITIINNRRADNVVTLFALNDLVQELALDKIFLSLYLDRQTKQINESGAILLVIDLILIKGGDILVIE